MTPNFIGVDLSGLVAGEAVVTLRYVPPAYVVWGLVSTVPLLALGIGGMLFAIIGGGRHGLVSSKTELRRGADPDHKDK